MWKLLNKMGQRPQPYEFYTTEKLWNDSHISRQMLKIHLDEQVDLASRRPEYIHASVEWMVSKFQIGEGVRICDFGCGPGLYTEKFAQKGAEVTGVDFSINSIRYARKEAEKKKLMIDYQIRNYLDFHSEKKYELITMIFCDFCVLNPQQRARMLSVFWDHLADGGHIVMDVASLAEYDNRKEAVEFSYRLMNGFWAKGRYYGFRHSFKYPEEKILLDQYTIVQPGKQWAVYNWLQCYTLEGIAQELADQGFVMTEYYSDLQGSIYDPASKTIGVVIRKR